MRRRGEIRKDSVLRSLLAPLDGLSRSITDLKFRLRGPTRARNKIAIVAIDDASLETLGRWPWPRDVMAQVIERVFQMGAKTVALDIAFSEEQRIMPEEMEEWLSAQKLLSHAKQWETDPKLAMVMELRAEQLITAWMTQAPCRPSEDKLECPVGSLQSQSSIPAQMSRFALPRVTRSPDFRDQKTRVISAVDLIPLAPPFLAVARHSGFVNGLRDTDGGVRTAPLVMMLGGLPYPSLALETARVSTGKELEILLTSDHAVGDLRFQGQPGTITSASTGVVGINYRGPEGTFPYVSIRDLFGMGIRDFEVQKNLERARQKLEGSIAIIGMTALAFQDVAATPFDPILPGVEVHANILDNILAGDLLHEERPLWSVGLMMLLIVTMGVGLSWMGQAWHARPAFFGFAICGSSILLYDFTIAPRLDLFLNSALLYTEFFEVFLSTLGMRYVRERKQRRFLRTAFSKYLSPAVVDLIVKNPSLLTLGGKKETLTILFSDIRDFTTFSESVDAKLLSEFLNEYLTEATNIVFKHGGTLDKYIGDAIMAFWGAPIPIKDHALRACSAAQEILQKVKEKQPYYKEKYGILLKIGIGINTGAVSVGNMGSENSLSYTIIGDHVNLGSRLEGATKNYGVSAIVSRNTIDAIREVGGQVPAVRPLGMVEVKGRKAAVEIFELLPETKGEESTQRAA